MSLKASDHPAIVFTVYALAFIPLGFLYAFDFISEKWRPVGETRRMGLLQALASIPCLLGIAAYIVLNCMDQDYKEAAAMIAVAFVHAYYWLRTVWGLIQLVEFKEWNAQAMITLSQLGYCAKEYRNCVLAKRNASPAGRRRDIRTLDIDAVRETVDLHMVVNSSLIDNEFVANPFELRLSLSKIRHIAQGKHLHLLSRLVTPRQIAPCTVRWLVSFLARFGHQWLAESARLGVVSGKSKQMKRYRHLTALNLGIVSALHTEPSCKSGVSPLTRSCISNNVFQSTIISGDALATIPFGGPGIPSQTASIDFNQHLKTIRDAAVDDWHKSSANALHDEARRAIVEVSPTQLACFARFMAERRNFHTKEERGLWNEDISLLNEDRDSREEKISSRNDPRIDIWMYQLGLQDGQDADNFFLELPVNKWIPLGASFKSRSGNWLLQASIHADNLLALEAGDCMNLHVKNVHFSSQFQLEMGRLQVRTRGTKGVNSKDTARFLGCIMETVRSNLARWVKTFPGEALKRQGWEETRILHDRPVLVELSPCAHEIFVGLNNAESDQLTMSKSLQLLWEIQSELVPRLDAIGNGQESVDLREDLNCLALVVLGFPALKVRVNDSSISLAVRMGRRQILQQFESYDIEEHGCSSPMSSLYLPKFVTIEPVSGPQKIKLLLEQTDNGNRLAIFVLSEDGFFKWDVWKTAFLSRLNAQKQWRSSRCLSKLEYFLDVDAHRNISRDICRPVSRVRTEIEGSEHELLFWRGWPPFLPQIAIFETSEFLSSHGSLRMYSRKYLTRALNNFLGTFKEIQGDETKRIDKRYVVDECIMSIAENGDKDALELVIKLLGDSSCRNESLERLERSLRQWLDRLVESRRPGTIQQALKDASPITLTDLAQSCETLYENTELDMFLLLKVRALIAQKDPGESIVPAAIAAAESFLLVGSSLINLYSMHVFLAAAHKSCGNEDLSAKKWVDAALCLRGYSAAISIGYLLEKGHLRQCEKKEIAAMEDVLRGREPEISRLLRWHFVKGNDKQMNFVQVGIGAFQRRAIEVYKHVVGSVRRTPPESTRFYSLELSTASNRLGILYQLAEPPEVSKARHWYLAAAEKNFAAAKSNLRLLEAFHSTETQSIAACEASAKQGGSCEANNFAIMCEIAKNTAKAKKWYIEAMERDGNNMHALFNLLILLVFSREKKEAEFHLQLLSENLDLLPSDSLLVDQVHEMQGSQDWQERVRWEGEIEIEERRHYLTGLKRIQILSRPGA